jgi:uncharacterized protein
VPSPLAWPLAYRFPVQQLRADFQPDEPPDQPTFLLVLREPGGAIRFKSIDALGFHLLQALSANDGGRSGRAVLEGIAAQAGVAATDVAGFVASGGRLLDQLRQRHALLGSLPASD